MANNCMKYYPNLTWQCGVMVRTLIFGICALSDLDLGDMTLGQGHDIPLGHEQQLCEILSRFNMAGSSYGMDTYF